MENIWFQSALWMALALVAAIGSLFITISAALFEIVIGAIAGNTVGLPLTPWIDYIAGLIKNPKAPAATRAIDGPF